MRADVRVTRVDDYEMLLAGDLEAEFVGTENCLAKCHTHDKVAKDLELSVHGAQIDELSGLPLVNCESCHGAGSKAVDNLVDGKACDTKALMPISNFPAQAQALVCLKCHAAASTPTLMHWNASVHANNDVSCFDCHNLHAGPQQKVSHDEMKDLCGKCHVAVVQEFNNFSHHPVPEGKMACTDCHNPHGTAQDKLLIGTTVKETCTRCHMEYQGPFIYEHADVTEDCTNCHRPHGAPSNPLLSQNQPFLCMQCHASHNMAFMGPGLVSGDISTPLPAGSDELALKKAFYTRCTDCHSRIHGTDIPSRGVGTFTAQ
ncbi:MAG: cytochrome C [Desulfuromonas sp.]|nr:MAG: cytochrome C [Desulfuromonas sp.]